MGRDEILRTFSAHAASADVSLIEGNKGLYDGLDLDGSNSNAALAHLLATPVVLVIDARGMTRGIAPLILGYQAFDPGIRIAGVILNQLGGSRHEAKLRAVIEHYTDVPVLGAVHHDDNLTIVERHLGLVPSNEATEADDRIATIAASVAEQVDLHQLLALATQAPPLAEVSAVPAAALPVTAPDVRIGIARDAAFAFYYPGDLDALARAGATLVPIDTLRDTRLPEIDALFLGGGFPEVHMQALEANRPLRAEIRAAIENGLPAYAECGGLMYLSRSLAWNDRRCEMVGVIPGDVVMHDRPQGRGYVKLHETGKGLWPLGDAGGEIRAHEFHYSSLENLPPATTYAYDVLRGTGVDGRHDGIVHRNLLACYVHMRDLDNNHWATRFVEFARRHMNRPSSGRQQAIR